MSNAELTQRWQGSLMDNYGTPRLPLVRGEGAKVWDADGNEYLDLLAGIAVNALGHAHPAVVEAVAEQLSTLGHVSNLFASQPQVTLAEKLLSLLGHDGRVFFTNSGTEANEAAFKATRKTGRSTIIAAEGSFHGRTMGALALTSKQEYREPFEPLPGDVRWVPYGDAAALAAAMDDTVAAVILEPIQGEAGVVVPPDDYLEQARQITTAHGALLWLDEVQTGMGRTGSWFDHQSSGIVPDLVTLAKGLGGGLPIGALIGVGSAASLLKPGNHGTTFGGNPVAAAAALAVIETIEKDGLLDQVLAVGDLLAERLSAHPLVEKVTGQGLLLGIVLREPVSLAVHRRALEAGLIVNAPTPDRLRLAPPLILNADEAGTAAVRLTAVFDEVMNP